MWDWTDVGIKGRPVRNADKARTHQSEISTHSGGFQCVRKYDVSMQSDFPLLKKHHL